MEQETIRRIARLERKIERLESLPPRSRLLVQDEGVTLPDSYYEEMNFEGAGVVASQDPTNDRKVNVEVAGAAGGGGGWTLLDTQGPSVDRYVFNNFDPYVHYMVIGQASGTGGGGGAFAELRMRVNGNSGSNYYYGNANPPLTYFLISALVDTSTNCIGGTSFRIMIPSADTSQSVGRFCNWRSAGIRYTNALCTSVTNFAKSETGIYFNPVVSYTADVTSITIYLSANQLINDPVLNFAELWGLQEIV